MEQVVLTPQNLPVQLHLLAKNLPVQGRPSLCSLFLHAYETDQFPGEILKAIQTQGTMTDITMAACWEQERIMKCRGKCYDLEDDRLQLRLIQEHDDTTPARHPGRAKTFDILH